MKFATVQKVKSLEPIEGADKIVKCLFEDISFQAVVQKGLHNVGDKCVYVETDTVVPNTPLFSFMENKKFRVKGIRLKGIWSEGIVLKFNDLATCIDGHQNGPEARATIESYLEETYKIGDCVSEILNVIKYEKPLPNNKTQGNPKGSFPSFLKKTDEPRLQKYPKALEEFNNIEIYGGAKIDGSSVSFYLHENIFGVCSRNLDWELEGNDDNCFIKAAKKYNLEEALRSHGNNIAVQGEVFGNGELNLFNIWDTISHKYGDLAELEAFCAKTKIPMVSILFKDNKTWTIEELESIANNLKDDKGKYMEGVVLRPVKETYSEILKGRLSVKILSNNYKD